MTQRKICLILLLFALGWLPSSVQAQFQQNYVLIHIESMTQNYIRWNGPDKDLFDFSSRDVVFGTNLIRVYSRGRNGQTNSMWVERWLGYGTYGNLQFRSWVADEIVGPPRSSVIVTNTSLDTVGSVLDIDDFRLLVGKMRTSDGFYNHLWSGNITFYLFNRHEDTWFTGTFICFTDKGERRYTTPKIAPGSGISFEMHLGDCKWISVEGFTSTRLYLAPTQTTITRNIGRVGDAIYRTIGGK